jgi:predicted RNase H-related nuclease YkuK (DUF458 family)
MSAPPLSIDLKEPVLLPPLSKKHPAGEPASHNFHEFISPTSGTISFDSMFSVIVDYINQSPADAYNLIVGTDSFLNSETMFVSAVIIHRVGHGGRYFYRKNPRRKIENLKQRIFFEATMSIELASLLKDRLDSSSLRKLAVEIHLDVGDKGETREIIREIVGMVTGSGYAARTKPGSFGASKVADRHSK